MDLSNMKEQGNVNTPQCTKQSRLLNTLFTVSEDLSLSINEYVA